MAEVSLTFRSTPSQIDTLELDAAVSETATFVSDVSEHPVESGSSIVDHVRPKPVEVKIDGIVTDTPLSMVQVRRAAQATGVELESPQNTPGRADAALAALLDLRDNPRRITVTTKRRVYSDMVLVSLTVPEDRATGDALRFSAAFRQVRTVTLRRVALRTATPATKPRVKAGPKPTKTAPVETTNKSILKKLSDSPTVNGARASVGRLFGIGS